MVRRVRDGDVALRREAVRQEVVEDAAVLAAQDRIDRAPDGQGGDIVGDQPLQQVARLRAGALDLAHVRDVEYARRRADGEVLLADASVLDGHLPTGERDHPGRRGDVTVVQRSALQGLRGGFGHSSAHVSSGLSAPGRPSVRDLAGAMRGAEGDCAGSALRAAPPRGRTSMRLRADARADSHLERAGAPVTRSIRQPEDRVARRGVRACALALAVAACAVAAVPAGAAARERRLPARPRRAARAPTPARRPRTRTRRRSDDRPRRAGAPDAAASQPADAPRPVAQRPTAGGGRPANDASLAIRRLDVTARVSLTAERAGAHHGHVRPAAGIARGAGPPLRANGSARRLVLSRDGAVRSRHRATVRLRVTGMRRRRLRGERAGRRGAGDARPRRRGAAAGRLSRPAGPGRERRRAVPRAAPVGERDGCASCPASSSTGRRGRADRAAARRGPPSCAALMSLRWSFRSSAVMSAWSCSPRCTRTVESACLASRPPAWRQGGFPHSWCGSVPLGHIFGDAGTHRPVAPDSGLRPARRRRR